MKKIAKRYWVLGCLLLVLLLASACQDSQSQENSVSGNPSDPAPVTDNNAGTNSSSSDAIGEETPLQPEDTIYSDMPVIEAEAALEDPDYYQKALEAEVYNYKLIRNVPTAYTQESWEAYYSVANTLLNADPNNISASFQEVIDSSAEARRALVQIKPAADCMWLIWGEDMASVKEVTQEDFSIASYDSFEARPFLVPYLVEDQAAAKGNIIAIAGGGYSTRANNSEGYPIAEAFRDLGYNAYVLQRRVNPYQAEDSWLDLQRSVRWLRHNGEALGLGGLDCIAAAGFSGGSGTVLGTVAQLYGDIQPTVFDSGYHPDAVDGESADMDVVFPHYGPQYQYRDGSVTTDYQGLVTDNPHLPAMLLGVGEDDDMALADIFTLAESVRGRTLVEVHTFAATGHGYAAGRPDSNSPFWIPMADNFMTLVKTLRAEETGEEPVAQAPSAEIPEEYTLTQTYTCTAGFGEAVVTCGVNEDRSKFYITFAAFGDQQILEGTLDGNTVTVTYDKSGFMAQDAQTLFDAAAPDGWEVRS